MLLPFIHNVPLANVFVHKQVIYYPGNIQDFFFLLIAKIIGMFGGCWLVSNINFSTVFLCLISCWGIYSRDIPSSKWKQNNLENRYCVLCKIYATYLKLRGLENYVCILYTIVLPWFYIIYYLILLKIYRFTS